MRIHAINAGVFDEHTTDGFYYIYRAKGSLAPASLCFISYVYIILILVSTLRVSSSLIIETTNCLRYNTYIPYIYNYLARACVRYYRKLPPARVHCTQKSACAWFLFRTTWEFISSPFYLSGTSIRYRDIYIYSFVLSRAEKILKRTKIHVTVNIAIFLNFRTYLFTFYEIQSYWQFFISRNIQRMYLTSLANIRSRYVSENIPASTYIIM